MATLGPNYVTGITTSVNATDIAFKEYVDNHTGGITATTDSDSGKLLVSDGSASSWDYLSQRLEFETAGTTNNTVPSRVNKLFISATGSGGGGGTGELDGAKVPKLTSWKQRTGSFNSYSRYYYGSITYGDSPSGNKWINTGQSARIETSTDSIYWTSRTHGNSGNSQYWWDGTYVNGEFLLVGYNYSVSASTDAIHWFARTANFGVQYNTINYGADGNYCIAGDSGRILASTDAVHWIARTGAHSSDNNWVGYLNNDWHMCGQSNNYSVSTDTIHWTKRTIPNGSSGYEINSAVYHTGQQLYVVFTQYSYYANDSVGHGIHVSTDSIHWVHRTSSFGGRSINYQFYASEYIPSIQTVVACGTYASVVSSTDTIHWTYSKSRPEENGSDENYDIATDNTDNVLLTGRYQIMIRNSSLKSYGISGGGGGPSVAPRYEINGSSISKNNTLDVTVGAGGRGGGKVHSEQWTLRTMGISTNRLEENGYPAVQYNGYWVVGSKISASTDSIHWSARTLPPLPASTQAWGVAYGDLLLMTSGNNYFLCTSTDSIVWTLRTTSIDDNKAMFYDGIGTWLVAGGPYGTTPNGLVVSTDTIHWTRRTLGASVATQTGFAFDGYDTYVLGTYNSSAGRSNGLSSSTDTIHWTKRTIGFGSLNTKKVNYSYATKNFYVVGEGNGLFASTDAIHWAKRTVPFANANVIYSYSTGYNQHVIGSEDGIATSTDSIHWTLRTHNFTEAGPRYIGYGDQKFMVTNGSGSPNYKDEIAILDVSAQDGEDTTVSWKGKGVTDLTINGDVAVNTTTKPTGASSSYYFDGSGDYLTTANYASDFNFGSSDFTMEFWINSTKTGRIDPIGWNYNHMNAGWAGMILNYLGSGNIAWYENNNARITGSSSWNDGSWHHIAVTRGGNSVRMFLDGTQVGSTYTTSHSYGAASSSFMIGTLTSIPSTGPMQGYISNFRVIKGEALYTAAFTPPTPDLQFTDHTVLLTCKGSDISAIDAQQTYSITVPGGKGANKNNGGSRLEDSDIQNGYTYLPTNVDSSSGENSAFGLGGDGSTADSSYQTQTTYQHPSGGGGGGTAGYPNSGTGAGGQRVYYGESQTGVPQASTTVNGPDGYRIQDNVYGVGAYGGNATSTKSLGSFIRRTFYGMSGYSSSKITGTYVDYLGLFVLANNTTNNTQSTTHLQVSTDTIHWTLRTYPFPSSTSFNWTGFANAQRPIDDDGTQVLLSNLNRDSTHGANPNTLAVSTDTIHWILRTGASMNSGTNSPNNIKYGNNLWLWTFNGGGLQTSTDTIHWTIRTQGFSGTASMNSVAYGNGRWVATHTSGGNPYTSTDAIHWKARTAGMNNSYQGYGIIYAEPEDGENIFVYGNYRNVAWSTDGIRWFKRTQSQTHYVYSFAYSSVLNKYLMTDYYGRVFQFDASGPLEDLFSLNTAYESGTNYVSGYHIFGTDDANVIYTGNSNYMVQSNIMSIDLGNGGKGGPGAGGGGAGVISKSALSGHGGDGGDGSVHISMI